MHKTTAASSNTHKHHSGNYLSRCPGEGEATDVCRDVVGVVMGHSNGARVTVDNTLVIKLRKTTKHSYKLLAWALLQSMCNIPDVRVARTLSY